MTRAGFGFVAVLAAAAAAAQAPAAVEVALGPAVQARLHELGRGDLDEQAAYLRRVVTAAFSRGALAGAAAHLVIADIEPGRPTSAEFGASEQLNHSSAGLGGAAVTGEVVTADGRRLPVRYRFFQDGLRNETNFTTWGDADQAFDDLAARIAKGEVPDDPRSWPPPHPARTPTGTRIPG